jgi:hypothetical protein
MVDMDTKRPIFFITTLSGVPPQDLVPVPGSTYIGMSQRIKPTQGTASATKKQPETSRKTKPRRQSSSEEDELEVEELATVPATHATT